MEQESRIAVMAIIVENRDSVDEVNKPAYRIHRPGCAQ